MKWLSGPLRRTWRPTLIQSLRIRGIVAATDCGPTMQYEPLAFPGLIFLAVVNLAFYGACITFVVKGVRGLDHGNFPKASLMLLGLAPFAWFRTVAVQSPVAVRVRAAEVASWLRKPVTAEPCLAIMVVEGSIVSRGYARALVSAGPFETAYGNGGVDGWFVYERRAGPDCPTNARPRSYND